MLGRKLVVCVAVGGILLIAGIHAVATWLTEVGVVEIAGRIRAEFLTGTAIAVIVALMILLPDRFSRRPEGRSDRWPFD